jgi:hypothetical protein
MSRADPQSLVRSARELSVDNRRDHDPNVPIRSQVARLSIDPSERLLKIRLAQFIDDSVASFETRDEMRQAGSFP